MPTLAQKIIAKASGRDEVVPGEIVTCQVDLAMSHDSSGPRRVAPMLESIGAKVWDPAKYVIITDHFVPANDADTEKILTFTRDWVRSAGIRHFYDEQGICHVVLAEHGHVAPGMLIAGGDSHSTTGGAFGAYEFGMGATEMFGVLATGEIWLKVPGTILIEWTSRLSTGVSAKDMMLFLCGHLGMDGGQYQAVEYTGSAVRALGMEERITLSNMAAELGAQAGLIAPDATTRAYLAAAGATDASDQDHWKTDPDAALISHLQFDASSLTPHVAAPHSPANAAPVGDYVNQVIDTAYIGACTGGKLEDLRMAARVLRGRKVAPGTRLLIAPASVAALDAAREDGTHAILTEAGAQWLPASCGACAGYGLRFEENERVISSTARNFKGRMGADSCQVWLGSPYTVAASAVQGRIADPRPLLKETR